MKNYKCKNKDKEGVLIISALNIKTISLYLEIHTKYPEDWTIEEIK